MLFGSVRMQQFESMAKPRRKRTGESVHPRKKKCSTSGRTTNQCVCAAGKFNGGKPYESVQGIEVIGMLHDIYKDALDLT